MKPFLECLAGYVLSEYRQKLADICMVFPNRRAGLFFTRHLSRIIEKPVWKPVIYTISDLMGELSGLKYADDLALISGLYHIYRDELKSSESFDEFYPWGVILLSDFDDVDKYMADAGDLFQNLAEVKEMDRKLDYLSGEQVAVIRRFWNSFDPGSPGVHQQRFIDLWNVLGRIYYRFTGSLRERGTGYEGLVYRDVAGRIRQGESPSLRFSRYIFAGFNALNRCEEHLFDHLRNNHLADFFWDYDDYYLKNDLHEAGRFLRKYVSRYPSPGLPGTGSGQGIQDSKVTVVCAPSDAAQARMIPVIMDELRAGDRGAPDDWQDTAIVLADEHMLLPVLHSLPGETGGINVTMGYPVGQTKMNSLMELLLVMQKNMVTREGHPRFSTRDVVTVLKHQSVRELHAADRESLSGMLRDRNLPWAEPGMLQLNPLFDVMFRPVPGQGSYPEYLTGVLEKISTESDTAGIRIPPIEQEHIHHIYLRLKRLSDVLSEGGMQVSAGIFYRLYRQAVSSTRIPFTGEPLAGVQVMGVLETRLLDFRNVIMLSLNEGYFPGTSVSPSFVPHYLRYAFGLPTAEHRDAIYAYYFYRLIQRAENVSLLFNGNTEGLMKGERSRFLYQLQYDPRVKTEQKVIGFHVGIRRQDPVVIRKNQRVLETLKKFHAPDGKDYLSASALNTYMDCGFRFFLRYVAGLREPDTVVGEIDAPVFGTIFHDAAAALYRSLAGGQVNSQDIDRLKENERLFGDIVNGALRGNLSGNNSSVEFRVTGKNLIIREVILQYLKNVLNLDRKYAPFRLLGTEQRHIAEFPVKQVGQTISIRMGGVIDRVDEAAGRIRILDYKTGSARRDFSGIDELFTRHDHGRPGALFQVLLYCRLFAYANPGAASLVPGLYILQDMHEESYGYSLRMGRPGNRVNLERFEDVKEDFDQRLLQLAGEIFDPGIPFLQTEDRRSCTYCSFAGICYRDAGNGQVSATG